jgi:hypothetical protein
VRRRARRRRSRRSAAAARFASGAPRRDAPCRRGPPAARGGRARRGVDARGWAARRAVRTRDRRGRRERCSRLVKAPLEGAEGRCRRGIGAAPAIARASTGRWRVRRTSGGAHALLPEAAHVLGSAGGRRMARGVAAAGLRPEPRLGAARARFSR